MLSRSFRLFFSSLVLSSLCFGLAKGSAAQEGASQSEALSAYVAKVDDSYGWKQRQTGQVGTCKFVELTLTSQTWQETAWRHQLFVLLPNSAPQDVSHALLFITGGSWKDRYAEELDAQELPGDSALFVTLAEQLKTPVVVVRQVPFQPMFGGRYEDDLIAHTFEKFVRTGDEEWPLLLPMVKSAVKAMDASTEWVQQNWSREIKTFTVTGASKRGWTTWLTGATDRRAVALAPMVIDVLNMSPQMKHQREVWGTYSEQIGDYTERGLQDLLEKDVGKKLRQIVDPFSYRNRIPQPKLILIGTNDRYWPLDALDFYWSDLVGEKYVVYVPNRGHGLEDLPRVLGGIHALHLQAQGIQAMPKPEWNYAETESGIRLTMRSEEKPAAVEVWTAESEKRDFREAKFSPRVAKRVGDGYQFDLATPKSGFVACFGELSFDRDGLTCFLSTNVKILAASTPGSE